MSMTMRKTLRAWIYDVILLGNIRLYLSQWNKWILGIPAVYIQDQHIFSLCALFYILTKGFLQVDEPSQIWPIAQKLAQLGYIFA